MLLEHLPHRQLTRGRQLHELTVAVEKETASAGQQILAEQEFIDALLRFGIAKGLAHPVHRHPVVGPERPQHMGLHQVPE